MIIDAFIPEMIGSYYIRPKKVLGLDVTKTMVYGCLITLYKHTCTIEKIFTENISTDASQEYNDRLRAVIEKITEQAGTCIIVTNISSHQILFKEFIFPFLDAQKIAQLIPYEAAHTMAVNITHTAIDFIVTEQNKELSTTTIMAAAVPNEALKGQEEIFSSFKQYTHKYTIPLFELYGLFLNIKAYAQSNAEATFLMHIDFSSTTISCIVGTQLKFIRIIPKGIIHIMRHVGQILDIQSSQAFESLIRFGIPNHENAESKKSIEDGIDTALNDVVFTIESIKNMLPANTAYQRLLLVGPISAIENIAHYTSEKIGIPTELFDINMHLKTIPIVIKSGAIIKAEHAIACALALPNNKTQDFSISHSTNKQQSQRARTQIIAGLGLTTFTLLLLIISYAWQIQSLKSTAYNLESAVTNHLRSLGLSTKKNAKQAFDEAHDNVAKEESLWFAFSRDQRFSFLETLQLLSTAIDRKGIGLNLKKMVVNTAEITLEGEVKDYEANWS